MFTEQTLAVQISWMYVPDSHLVHGSPHCLEVSSAAVFLLCSTAGLGDFINHQFLPHEQKQHNQVLYCGRARSAIGLLATEIHMSARS